MSESPEKFLDISKNDSRVFDIVRLALMSEYSKTPIRREDITELVSTSLRKQNFDAAISFANEHLQDKFGYQLVPLPVIAVRPVRVAGPTTSASRKAAIAKTVKATSKQAAAPSSYILITSLKPSERELIPRTTRDGRRLAIIQTILMAVKLSGNNLDHHDLLSALTELSLLTPGSEEMEFANLHEILDDLKRQKYLNKQKDGFDESRTLYSWGPRSYVEYSPRNMADFLEEVAKSGETEIDKNFKVHAFKVLSQNV